LNPLLGGKNCYTFSSVGRRGKHPSKRWKKGNDSIIQRGKEKREASWLEGEGAFAAGKTRRGKVESSSWGEGNGWPMGVRVVGGVHPIARGGG